MKYNPDIHHRRSIRLKGYDYSSSGLYFITICTHKRLHLFGEVLGTGAKSAKNDNPASNRARAGLEPAPTNMNMAAVPSVAKMELNDFGRIVEYTWFDLVSHVSNIQLHEFIVMPNHIHGIIQIIRSDSIHNNQAFNRAGLEPAPTNVLKWKRKPQAISEIVRQLKTFSARRINKLRNRPGIPVWQRNYHEHIIRNDESYLKIAEYVQHNPLLWENDRYYG